MISIKHKGNFKKTEQFLKNCWNMYDSGILDYYGRKGVAALSNATPVRTGLAANSWYYEIEKTNGGVKIIWSNSDIEGDCNVAILIQYGHGTRNGGYVRGIDYVNPAMRPIFDEIAEELMRGIRQ